MVIRGNGRVSGCIAWLMLTSACSGSILLGSSDASDGRADVVAIGGDTSNSSSSSSGGSVGGSGSGGGSGSSSAGSSGGTTAPSWTYIYMTDLTTQTCGGLGCHVEWSGASSAYNYLQSQGCLPSMGCIKGFGAPGNMPILGNISSSATLDILAWIAAGAPNN